MEVLTLFLLCVAVLKVTSILQGIRWLTRGGRAYVNILQRNPPNCEADYYPAFDGSGGNVFPFGIKDYILREFIVRMRSGSLPSRLVSAFAWVFQATLYRYQRFAGLCGLYIIVAASLSARSVTLEGGNFQTHSLLLYALAAILLMCNSLLSIEAVFSYAILGGYATSFHMLSPLRDRWSGGSRILLELKVIMARVATTIYTGSVAAYVAYVLFQGLEGKALHQFDAVDACSWIAVFFQLVYWATTTFVTVGYGDICPANGWGQAVAFFIEIQAFAVFAIVFASVFQSKGVT